MSGPRVRRALAVAVMLAAAMLVSGCVYLRLLELKHQFADFDRNFAIDASDGVRITCRHPVLLTGDVRWIGLRPEKTRRVGVAEDWTVRWVKQLPAGVHESVAYDLAVELLFAEDQLTRATIPERYFAAMPKALFVDLLRSLGHARVDRDRRSVEAAVDRAPPTRGEIERLLGRPTEQRSDGRTLVYRYRYVPATPRGLARAAVFDLTVTFDAGSGRIRRWHGHTPVGDMSFTFPERAPAGAPTP